MEELHNGLESAGLSENEIKVYIYLLKEGVSSPAQVARGTKIARSNVYYILRNLDDEDLIEQQRKNNRYVYKACRPESLIDQLERRRSGLERIIPDLNDLYKVQKNKPVVEYFDGLERIKDIFLESLHTENLVRSVESTGLLYKIDRDFFRRYDELLKKKGIFTHDLLTMDSTHEIAKEVASSHGPYYKYRLMQKKYNDLSGQILIWNDNVAHISFEQSYFGTIIRESSIAGAMRALFDTAWEGAEVKGNSLTSL